MFKSQYVKLSILIDWQSTFGPNHSLTAALFPLVSITTVNKGFGISFHTVKLSV